MVVQEQVRSLDHELVRALREKDDLTAAKERLEADLAEAARDIEVAENDKGA